MVYLRGHEGRGIGITHKLQAYELQDGGLDTVDANVELGLPVDSREYGIGAQILVDLGITTMRLMTNNPAKRGGLEGFGLQIVERVPIHTIPNEENIRYLQTKRDRLGHLFDEGRGVVTVYEGHLRGDGLRVAIAASRFNEAIVVRLVDGALDGLRRHGVDPEAIDVAWAPGAFELPLVAARLAGSRPLRRGDHPGGGHSGRHRPLRLGRRPVCGRRPAGPARRRGARSSSGC